MIANVTVFNCLSFTVSISSKRKSVIFFTMNFQLTPLKTLNLNMIILWFVSIHFSCAYIYFCFLFLQNAFEVNFLCLFSFLLNRPVWDEVPYVRWGTVCSLGKVLKPDVSSSRLCFFYLHTVITILPTVIEHAMWRKGSRCVGLCANGVQSVCWSIIKALVSQWGGAR